jgi:hypothetical protein
MFVEYERVHYQIELENAMLQHIGNYMYRRIIIPDHCTAHEEKRGEVWQAEVGQRFQQNCESGWEDNAL